MSQSDLIMEFFKKNPNQEIQHPEVVDWSVSEYKKRTGGVFRDPDRAIRKLSQEGVLIKIRKGVYKFDPDFASAHDLQDFSAAQKAEIFKRDHYRCVVCGRGFSEGVEIHADHIKPRDLGGKAEIENGQTFMRSAQFSKEKLQADRNGQEDVYPAL